LRKAIPSHERVGQFWFALGNTAKPSIRGAPDGGYVSVYVLVLDLLGTPMTGDKYRDLISINEFAATKPYSSEASAGMYDEYLAKTFAVASYESSQNRFQTFMEYGAYCPEPLYWALKGDCL